MNKFVMEDDVELMLTSTLNVHHQLVPAELSAENSSDIIDTDSAELLQNGIFVETKQGLVCLTLKDALTSDIGGLNLSVEDLQQVAEHLLQQNASLGVPQSSSTGSPSEISEVSETSEVELSSSEEVKQTYEVVLPEMFTSKNTLFSMGLENSIPISALKSCTVLSGTENVVSIEPVVPKTMHVPAAVARANSTTESSQKKRGGWPKGRKRKPEVTLRAPKAPATGYVLYLNERRKFYKNIPFTEVTKLLGNEWSRMSLDEKKVYLERAEVEKKRYKKELLLYRKSDAYRAYLNKQREKRIQDNGTEESDMDATDEIDDEDNEELYCRTCDQYFNTLHNKKEHLYGRQHLQSISLDFSKKRSAKTREVLETETSALSVDDSSLDGAASLAVLPRNLIADSSASFNGERSNLPYMDGAVANFMQIIVDREREAAVLRQRVRSLTSERVELEKQVNQLRNEEAENKAAFEAECAIAADLENQLYSLLAVPALFILSDAETLENNLEQPTSCVLDSGIEHSEVPSASLMENTDAVLVLTEGIDIMSDLGAISQVVL